MSRKLRALVLCPGRGSYSRETLGSLSGVDAPSLEPLETLRSALGRPTVRQLDAAERFSPRLHLAGEHASILTAGCTLADLDQLDPERVEIVAVCGNSMGWYTALAAAGALSLNDGARLVETMGSYQAGNVIGGQIVYPTHRGDWTPDPKKLAVVNEVVEAVEGLFWSIRLGGQAVLAGSEDALAEASRRLPPIIGRYRFPLRLPMHSAFHTPMLAGAAERAAVDLADLAFRTPRVPLVDGRGQVYRPLTADLAELMAYTLGAQVVEMYDFTRMLRTALREYAPEVVLLPGPGGSLGGAIGQVLVEEGWRGCRSRDDFQRIQASDRPLLISMPRPEQRTAVVR